MATNAGITPTTTTAAEWFEELGGRLADASFVARCIERRTADAERREEIATLIGRIRDLEQTVTLWRSEAER